MQYAYATFELKSVDEDQRIVVGMASTPGTDSQGDDLDPKGAKFSLPMPFGWKHADAIGQVISARVSDAGIEITAKIATIPEPGRLKDLVDFAWHSIKHRLVRGLSVGWNPLKATKNPGGRFKASEWEFGEVSAVMVPANRRATIALVKSLDLAPAASGSGARVSLPGVTGLSTRTPMNASEQLTQEKTNLQAKSARLEELLRLSDEGSIDEAGETELGELTPAIKSLTTKVERLTLLEASQAAGAKGITLQQHQIPMTHRAAVQGIQANTIEVVARPKAQAFVRYAMAVAAGRGSMSDTVEYARRWTDTPEVLAYIKQWHGKSDPGTSTGGVGAVPGWGGQLVNPNTMQTEFVELLRAATILGRIPGLRSVPFNIPIITQTGGSTFEWVGEGLAKPVGELAFSRTTLGYSKVAGIVVMTEELIRLSTPSAEATVRTELVEQCGRFIDTQFIQAAFAATAASPASVTNAVNATAATGNTAAEVLADLNTALALFDTAGIPTDGLVLVMTPGLARGISTLTTALGAYAFPGMNPNGGTLLGYPVVVSSAVDTGCIVIIKPSEIFLADDGGVTLDASNQATLDMDAGSPGSPIYSLWQRNAVGIRAERWIRWQKRRSAAVQVISGASYGPGPGSPP